MELSVGDRGFFTFLSACRRLWPPVARSAIMCPGALRGSTSSSVLSSFLQPLPSKKWPPDFSFGGCESWMWTDVVGNSSGQSGRDTWTERRKRRRRWETEEGQSSQLEGYFCLGLQTCEPSSIKLFCHSHWVRKLFFRSDTNWATCSRLVMPGFFTDAQLIWLCSNFFPVATQGTALRKKQSGPKHIYTWRLQSENKSLKNRWKGTCDPKHL